MKPNIRVLQVVASPRRTSSGWSVNGPERRSANLMRRWPASGIEMHTLYTSHGRLARQLAEQSASYGHYRFTSKWDVRAVYDIGRGVLQCRPAVLHTQGPPSLDMWCSLVARAFRVPFVVTRPVLLNEEYDSIGSKVKMWLDAPTLKRAARIVAVSCAGERALLGCPGVSRSRVRKIYNGVDLRHFSGEATRNDDLVRVGMVGQLRANKGVYEFCAMIGELVSRNDSVRGILIGDGPEYGALQEYVKTGGLGEYVELRGYIDDVACALAELDILVLPSYREGLSVAILEAMAMAIPVVATSTGGTREQVVHGRTGYVLRPGDEWSLVRYVEDLVNSPDKRRVYGAAGRRRAERLFSEERMAREYAAVYMEAAEG